VKCLMVRNVALLGRACWLLRRRRSYAVWPHQEASVAGCSSGPQMACVWQAVSFTLAEVGAYDLEFCTCIEVMLPTGQSSLTMLLPEVQLPLILRLHKH
jgi:hypothetical protein